MDLASNWLLEQALQSSQQELCLWPMDENLLDQSLSVSFSRFTDLSISIFTNRFDIYSNLSQQAIKSQFNDFDFMSIEDGSLDKVFYRISKEKPVAHHIINQAWQKLKLGGKLYLCGNKNEGIKSYCEKTSKLFGSSKNISKNGISYHTTIEKSTSNGELLDDKNYSKLRLLSSNSKLKDIKILSKPGQFGWDKVDRGSAFLIEHLDNFLSSLSIQPKSFLDLGCGYGYISLMTKHLPLEKRVATDNNAAAILSIKENAALNNMEIDISADDAGKHIEDAFDIILCNPPFHQGFNVDDRLTDKFLSQAKNLLSNKGAALFAVNSFIPLEKAAKPYFSNIDCIANNKSFKLIKLY